MYYVKKVQLNTQGTNKIKAFTKQIHQADTGCLIHGEHLNYQAGAWTKYRQSHRYFTQV